MMQKASVYITQEEHAKQAQLEKYAARMWKAGEFRNEWELFFDLCNHTSVAFAARIVSAIMPSWCDDDAD